MSINKEELLKRLDQYTPEQLAEIVKEALDASGIPYTEGVGGVTFSGLNLPGDRDDFGPMDEMEE